MPRRLIVMLGVIALVLATAAPATAAGRWERADILGQAPDREVVAEDGARILRTSQGVTASVSMPTPEPGTYTYPIGPTASGEVGHPEVFSLWVIIFFNPEVCGSDGCGADDVAKPEAVAGAFNAGGHPVGGPQLNITGHVNAADRVFGPGDPETVGEALAMGYRIADAEIHLAVAPHGALDPELLPEQMTTPAGGPGDWWVAVFEG